MADKAKTRTPAFQKVGVLVYCTQEQIRLIDEEAMAKQKVARDGRKVSRASVVLDALNLHLGTEEDTTDGE